MAAIPRAVLSAAKNGQWHFVHIHFPRRGYYTCKICFDWRNFIYESNRDRAPDRRLGYNRSKVRKP